MKNSFENVSVNVALLHIYSSDSGDGRTTLNTMKNMASSLFFKCCIRISYPEIPNNLLM